MNKINLPIILLILLGLTLGCLGPDGSETRCQGVVKFEGEKYVGAAKDEKRAGRNACNKYCLENDSELDLMYRAWLKTDRAKSLEELHGKKPTKWDALMEDKAMLRYNSDVCSVKCVNGANKGVHTLETSCLE